ncbi:MAG: ATP-binding cassette domain-containing protein, partial [Pseudonocardiaceae bacterium]
MRVHAAAVTAVIDGHQIVTSLVGLVGPNGSGKSTLLRCVNLLEPPEEGRILLEGKEITGKDAVEGIDFVRRRVGMVFQQFNHFPHRTALDNVSLAQEKVLDRREAEAHEKARGLLGRVGLADKVDEYPDRLSGGQQQRVARARALVSRPEMVFADEPTGALDRRTGQEILDLLRAGVDALSQTCVM